MCKSKAEGGVRCYGHGIKAYESARARLAGLPGNASTKQVAKVENAYETAVDRFAEHPKGHHHLTARLHDLRAGAPLDGDCAAVIEMALVDHAPVRRIPRPRSPLTGVGLVGGRTAPEPETEFAAHLAESLRTGRPLAEAGRTCSSKPEAPCETALARALRTGERDGDGAVRAPRHRKVSESPLDTALRTGDTTLMTDSSDIDEHTGGGDEPVSVGGITVARGQVPFLQRWGTDPVAVQSKMHVQHFKGDGWSEYDLDTESYKPVTDSGATSGEGGLFAKDTGVLVVRNARTGEKAALRARRDTATGHWTIHEDIADRVRCY